MSTILEFYIEKEKRELINTIGSAKYISEDQKNTLISIVEDDRDDWYAGHDPQKKKETDSSQNKPKYQHGTGVGGQSGNLSRSEAQKKYDETGKAPAGYKVKDGKVYPDSNR